MWLESIDKDVLNSNKNKAWQWNFASVFLLWLQYALVIFFLRLTVSTLVKGHRNQHSAKMQLIYWWSFCALVKIRDVKNAIKGGMHYMEIKQQLLLSYCQAITFYLLLKSEGQPVRDHPVISRLVEIKNLLDKVVSSLLVSEWMEDFCNLTHHMNISYLRSLWGWCMRVLILWDLFFT